MKLIIKILIFFSYMSIMASSLNKDSLAIVSSEFIFKTENVSFASCHASTIAETDEGLIASWFGGTNEGNPDVGIWVSRFNNGKWSNPIEVANGIQHKGLRYPTWNPVLFNTGKEVKLFYKIGLNCGDWWGEVISSKDNGKTWSTAQRLPHEIWGPIKNKPIRLRNGDLICPSSTENNGWKVHFEITTDLGLTWERTKNLNADSILVIQPTILVHEGEKLQMLCRSQNKTIFTAWSYDKGRSWMNLTSTSLPNPNSGIDAVTLHDGRHVLIYNHIKPDSNWGARNVLNMAVSTNGIKWNAALVLENETDTKAEYSYPAVIQTKDGLIHITYTWKRKLIKHVVVDPSKLVIKPIWE